MPNWLKLGKTTDGWVVYTGQDQRERPLDKAPRPGKQCVPDADEVEITPVDDILAELEKLREREHQGCGCMPPTRMPWDED